jgi:hypothetical protein
VENIPWSVYEEQFCTVGIWGEGLIPRSLRDSPTVDETFRLKLQHRLVLEFPCGLFHWIKDRHYGKSSGQRTPTATSIHQCNLADHQHEVTEPGLFGVHAADLLSDGGPCEGFCDTLEDDRA